MHSRQQKLTPRTKLSLEKNGITRATQSQTRASPDSYRLRAKKDRPHSQTKRFSHAGSSREISEDFLDGVLRKIGLPSFLLSTHVGVGSHLPTPETPRANILLYPIYDRKSGNWSFLFLGKPKLIDTLPESFDLKSPQLLYEWLWRYLPPLKLHHMRVLKN